MLQTILSSYKTYLKNFPVILLFAVPLLVLSGIEIYFEGLTSANRGVKYFISLALFILPLISAATDIAVYQRLFKSPRVNPFGSLKTLFALPLCSTGFGADCHIADYHFPGAVPNLYECRIRHDCGTVRQYVCRHLLSCPL
ncbi:MAG: hypothetical protein ACLU99_13205 [Alphaproteobacteria bacterium]